jgi:uncharacterized membrane protein YgaE (UPF0421/DUF939 family)
MQSKPRFTGLGIALGAVLGAVFGILAGHMVVWLAFGVAIGMLIGASFRRKAPTCPDCAKIDRVHEMRNERQQASS